MASDNERGTALFGGQKCMQGLTGSGLHASALQGISWDVNG